MNPRTVKKLKAEMEASLQFCSQMHNLLRGIIMDIDKAQIPHLPPYLPPSATSPSIPPPTVINPPPAAPAPAPVVNNAAMPWVVRNDASGGVQPKGTSKTDASAGNAEGSTLRKMRKTKLPPNLEPQPVVPEVDGAGRRLVNKKEHHIRLFEMLRFRALRSGDFVAARTTSRDLWILARVLKDYPGIENTPPLEFFQLSEARRDALFKEKVHIKDVEGDGHTFQVARNLVLPLPRTYSEAADWGSRIKKGMRCYSMYPETTSLYPATVYDSTTYCRGQDDILVVEFDGEEPDETGVIPKYHIPARFATLIPREFSSAQPPSVSSKKRKGIGGASGSPSKQQKTDDFLSFDFEGNFDALDMEFDMGDNGSDVGFPSLM
jgi:SGF29 tudor-like domain